MELDEHQTLKLVQDRMALKLYSHSDWPDFITWVKGITQTKFKALILQCLEDVVADGDAKKAELVEAKVLIEGTS